MITIAPANPSSDDTVTLTFSGAGCVNGTSRSTVGSDLQFSIDFSSLCFSPAPAFEFTWQVGRLAEGTYTASRYDSVDGGQETLNSSETFSVSMGLLPFPVQVPATTDATLSVLFVALIIAVGRKLKTARA